jgi:hypothetical protein
LAEGRQRSVKLGFLSISCHATRQHEKQRATPKKGRKPRDHTSIFNRSRPFRCDLCTSPTYQAATSRLRTGESNPPDRTTRPAETPICAELVSHVHPREAVKRRQDGVADARRKDSTPRSNSASLAASIHHRTSPVCRASVAPSAGA